MYYIICQQAQQWNNMFPISHDFWLIYKALNQEAKQEPLFGAFILNWVYHITLWKIRNITFGLF